MVTGTPERRLRDEIIRSIDKFYIIYSLDNLSKFSTCVVVLIIPIIVITFFR